MVNAISNMLKTLMIAGRVWWLSRSLWKELPSGAHSSHWYHRTLAVVTESGVIYPVYLTIEAILSRSLPFNIPNYVDMGSVIVGIAPTLVAVRVGLGSAVDDQSLRSNILQSQLLFATRPRSPSTAVLDIAPVGGVEYSARLSIPDLGRDVEKGLREVEL
ncbi:hypothetical protein BT96DRAFT_1066163 [Gymnopus androsaceus JB14]|uniref:Uncharacterized protein n=1 Tax=Gymnopus androsaceus JB14 TaxID=1447944 RepID=A0A6A4GY83_9AGAR|nr:hypothetical protein BT96DRAFT_1066163 [Gymnopus androsaceus JB14]